MLRTINRWRRPGSEQAATIMVPALYNFMPAESVALGWLNEIESLVTILQRTACAAKVTGWDAFTFHTLHNADRYYDSTIGAVCETWMKEGNLSAAAVRETKRQFGKGCDYHRIHARLVENLVFQSSLLNWITHQAAQTTVTFQVVGTALLSALASSGSITFSEAVESAMKVGGRWDQAVREAAKGTTEDEISWSAFRQVLSLMEGRSSISLGVSRKDLPAPKAPTRPFWFSADVTSEPMLITTAREAQNALEMMNLASWAYALPKVAPGGGASVRGWLISPLHPTARLCRWSISNYLLATPAAAHLFLEHVAAIDWKPRAASLDPVASEALPAIENESHRSLIGQLHVHHRLKDAGIYRNS